MNLFADETKTLLERFVSPDWAEQLSQYIDSETFKGIGRKVDAARKTAVVYPEHKDLFRALSYPFEKVRVVIVGQDPYHNGNADGLAFSCKQNLSPSLKQILQAIWDDELKHLEPDLRSSNSNFLTIKNYMANKNNWNLEYLAEQGVLLYNPTLTVEKGRAGSHKGIWDKFTEAVFISLLRRENIIWMLWGSEALKAYSNVSHNNLKSIEKRLTLTNEHPAAAAYRDEVWKCDHFTKCNQWLKDEGQQEIEWIQR